MASLAKVVFPLAVDRIFTYFIPGELRVKIRQGCRVLVEFGKKTRIGFVVDLGNDDISMKLKPVMEILEPEDFLDKGMVSFFKWIADYYSHPLGMVIKEAVPNKFYKGLKLPEKKRKSKVSEPAVSRAKDAVVQDEMLTHAQNASILKVRGFLDSMKFSPVLLWGITGSGKTEVYVRSVSHCLKQGRSAIILAPEIALSLGVENVFKQRFGEGRVAVIHSGISESVRLREWLRIKNGEAGVVIGARSAIFAPLDNIGLIVVDEEHERTYKQDDRLHYNARDMALVRGRMHNAVILLGSATPSVQSFYHAKQGRYSLLTMDYRVKNAVLPRVEIIDMRVDRPKDSTRSISSPLKEAIEENLEHNDLTLLFLNRRGFAPVYLCSRCGTAMRCRHCDVALTLHQDKNILICHYCGYHVPIISSCQQCGCMDLIPIGTGTQRLEHELAGYFPDASVVRIDSDVITSPKKMGDILSDIKEGRVDILIGTQILAKGHNFPRLTLAGVVDADISLNMPDFRASETTFQLLCQVAGRSGRDGNPGRVIIQTGNPGHFGVVAASAQSYQDFFEKEICVRERLNYPPFSKLVQLVIVAEDKRAGEAFSKRVKRAADAALASCENGSSINILGPAHAPLFRIRERYRWQLLIKGASHQALYDYTKMLLCNISAMKRPAAIKLQVDVDPMSML